MVSLHSMIKTHIYDNGINITKINVHEMCWAWQRCISSTTFNDGIVSKRRTSLFLHMSFAIIATLKQAIRSIEHRHHGHRNEIVTSNMHKIIINFWHRIRIGHVLQCLWRWCWLVGTWHDEVIKCFRSLSNNFSSCEEGFCNSYLDLDAENTSLSVLLLGNIFFFSIIKHVQRWWFPCIIFIFFLNEKIKMIRTLTIFIACD